MLLAALVAVLLQGVLVGPMALRMAAMAAAAQSLCRADADGHGGSPPDGDTGHRAHERCLICQGGAGPLLAPPPDCVVVPPDVVVTAAVPDHAQGTPPARPAAAYRSRAPPAAA